jgi:ABC-type branched-chain amino acid transport system, permease component
MDSGTYMIYCLIWGAIWGAISSVVGKNRGYNPGTSFLWGFLLGLIGFIVVIARKDLTKDPGYGAQGYYPPGYYPQGAPMNAQQGRLWFCTKCGMQNGNTNTCVRCGEQYWFCSMCGTPNSYATHVCGRCGYSGSTGAYVNTAQPQDQVQYQQQMPVQTPNDYASFTANNGPDELMRYKELLDRGVITQEEFDAKKKQILGL